MADFSAATQEAQQARIAAMKGKKVCQLARGFEEVLYQLYNSVAHLSILRKLIFSWHFLFRYFG
jgi:hypothetical protein